ncbi:GTPase [Paludisphaera borealis]|uniref:tRNA modification GTPase MnmE n=1 Tax=Paludisphaera borealis TaxID=1387353 RepID=A0A1U7CV22_9BACT|nr:GTPase [Paludisphaera borealis]APW62797.1 tRNA modification GTPase MnmE [Paludisphaera borealis]
MSEAAASRPSVCVLTPRGRGAIGVVRVWGEGALAAASAVFRPARGEGLGTTPRRRPRLGRIGSGLGDEVVAVVLDGEPPEVEIQCHGGPAAVDLVVETLTNAGGRLVEPGAFAEHAAGSPIRAAALEDLARASTLRTAEILLEQAQGALDAELDRLIAVIEADRGRGLAELDRLIERGRVGVRLIAGWRVVIAGRPNVGKSRLLNALAGYQRAIVDATPGTTRDVVTVSAAFDGWPVELVDTAGVRGTDDLIEQSGIERALREHRRADLLLKVFDRSQPLEVEDRRLLAADGDALVIVNKADLPAAWTPETAWMDAFAVVAVSAERGDGLDELGREIARRLVPNPPEPGAGLPFRTEQVEALRAARASFAVGNERAALQTLRSLAQVSTSGASGMRWRSDPLR